METIHLLEIRNKIRAIINEYPALKIWQFGEDQWVNPDRWGGFYMGFMEGWKVKDGDKSMAGLSKELSLKIMGELKAWVKDHGNWAIVSNVEKDERELEVIEFKLNNKNYFKYSADVDFSHHFWFKIENYPAIG